MASVEAEGELVEVRVEVLGSDRPLVGAEHPALEQARNTMDARHQDVSGIVLSGTKRLTPDAALSMPAFGDAYSDIEIAAVANYVTARFGSKPSSLTAQDVAELRKQASQ